MLVASAVLRGARPHDSVTIKSFDPLYGVDNARVTVKWFMSPCFSPENAMIGVSSLHGGYVDSHGMIPASEGYGEYTAYATHHWVFAGTGLAEGTEFGREATIVGYETDGAQFSWAGGYPVVTAADQTPSPSASSGSPRRRGATRPWASTSGEDRLHRRHHGLEPWSGRGLVASRITKNVLMRCSGSPGALQQNDPPIVVPLGDHVYALGRAIDLSFTAFDPELGTLSFSAAGLPPASPSIRTCR